MKSLIVAIVCSILLVPVCAFAEQPPDSQEFWSKLSRDLAELQNLNLEFEKQTGAISPYFMTPEGLQQMSTDDKKMIEKLMTKILDWIKTFLEEYDKLPVTLEGFSIGFPSGATVDFSIDLSEIKKYLPPD